jgi:hypothetical protein
MKGVYLGVKADWPQTYFWLEKPSISVGIEVRLWDIRPNLLSACQAQGSLRKVWKVPTHMPVMISTIMPDPLLDGLHVRKYIEKIKAIVPDSFTSIEIPLYNGDKGYMLAQRFEEYRLHLIELKKHFPCDRVVVLVPGRNDAETKRCATFAYDLGYTRMGLACADSIQRNPGRSIGQILSDLCIIRNFAKETYLFGLTSPILIEKYSIANYLVTRGWYHTTMKFKRILTHSGSRKIATPSIVPHDQQVFLGDTAVWADTINLENNRMRTLKSNAVAGIDVLLSKIAAIKHQKRMEEFAPWQEKILAEQEATIPPLLTVVPEEQVVTHI